MWIFGIVLLELAAAAAVICGFAFWDQPLRSWEDRQILKLRNAVSRLRRSLRCALDR
jgi:hypothetical protein